jgi:hypothetical protein
MSIIVQPFPWPNPEKGYLLFCKEWESDDLVAFHGTALANLQSIIKGGFRLGRSKSVSFARESSEALRHICSKQPGAENCVIAVRFTPPILRPGVASDGPHIHVNDLAEQPGVIGWCGPVPAAYVHL